MKHIDFEKNTFVMNMLIVDPRTGGGGPALVKCSIEDALACELITQKEVDAARQAKKDQVQKGLSEMARCDICEQVLPEDEIEQCFCKRNVCSNCSHYERELDTGAEYFENCKVCYEQACLADMEASKGEVEAMEKWEKEMERQREKELAEWNALTEEEKQKQIDAIEDIFEP